MEKHDLQSEETETIHLNKDQRVRDILGTPPSNILSFGPTAIFILVILLLLLSWVVKYPDIIVAEASITTKIPLQKQHARIDGQLSSIFIENESKVEPGTPIAVLENSANYKDVVLLKKCMDTISLEQRPFSFPMDHLPVLFLGDIEDHFSNFQNKYSQYQLNRNLLPFSNLSSTKNNSLIENKNQLKSLKAQKKLIVAKLRLQKKNEERSRKLYEKKVISELAFENERLIYLEQKRTLNEVNGRIFKLNEIIANANGIIKEIHINEEMEETQLLKNTIQAFNQLQNAIKNWEYKYVFQSHIKGTVSFMDFWNTYQSVNKGDLVFTVIPEINTSYVSKLKTPLKNSGKIQKGQKVNIRLTNYPEVEFGVIQGEIQNISSSINKDGFYIIDVSLPKKLVTTYNKKVEFKQEMQGSAEIITEDLRLMERLLYGFKNLLKG